MRTERYGRADKYEKLKSFSAICELTYKNCIERKTDSMSEKQKLEPSTEYFRTLLKKSTKAPSRHPTQLARLPTILKSS
jgi:hypothetical protein